MKNILFLFLILLSAVDFAKGQAFAGTGTDISTNLNYFVVPPFGGSRKARVLYVNATSDKAGSVIQFYNSAAPINVTNSSVSGTNVVWASGTGLSGSDILIVRSVSGETFQRVTVSSATDGYITLNQNLSFALVAGDKVYKATTAGFIPVGAATKEVNASVGGCYFSQGLDRPLLIDLDGTSAVHINAISGDYLK